MCLRAEPLPGTRDTVAMVYGPVVLAGELGSLGLDESKLYPLDPRGHILEEFPEPPVLVCDDPAELPRHFEPTGKPLCFRSRSVGKPEEISLIPYFRLHHQRQTVYWKVLTQAQWKRKEAAKARSAKWVPLKAEPFPLSQVRLLDGPFKDAMQRNSDYLLSIEPDRLLHSFRLNAGLPTQAEPLGGWEKPDWPVRGFTLGQYVSACSFMYSASGDDRFKDRVDIPHRRAG